MLRHFSIALLIAFGCLSASAQNGLRISGTPQPSGSFIRRPGFPISSGRRSLIALSGTSFRDQGRRHGFGRNSFFYGGWPYFPPDYYEDSFAPDAALQPAAPPPAQVVETKLEPVPSKVQLADLDLPRTVKQNQERGLKFDLPSGPNEVVLRP